MQPHFHSLLKYFSNKAFISIEKSAPSSRYFFLSFSLARLEESIRYIYSLRDFLRLWVHVRTPCWHLRGAGAGGGGMGELARAGVAIMEQLSLLTSAFSFVFSMRGTYCRHWLQAEDHQPRRHADKAANLVSTPFVDMWTRYVSARRERGLFFIRNWKSIV